MKLYALLALLGINSTYAQTIFDGPFPWENDPVDDSNMVEAEAHVPEEAHLKNKNGRRRLKGAGFFEIMKPMTHGAPEGKPHGGWGDDW